jgi:hypothetical protein
VEAFLHRVKTHCGLVAANDQEAITMMINAAQPHIASFISNNYVLDVTTKDTIWELVKQRFAPTKFQYYEQFRNFKPQTSQSARDIGNELRRLYLGFLQLSADRVKICEDAIAPVLTAQLLEILPRQVAGVLRTKVLETPDITWEEILSTADNLRHLVVQKAPEQEKQKQLYRSMLTCKIHGQVGHDDAHCRLQNRTPSLQKSTNTFPLPRNIPAPFACYECGQHGHKAADCRNSKNANTGSF